MDLEKLIGLQVTHKNPELGKGAIKSFQKDAGQVYITVVFEETGKKIEMQYQNAFLNFIKADEDTQKLIEQEIKEEEERKRQKEEQKEAEKKAKEERLNQIKANSKDYNSQNYSGIEETKDKNEYENEYNTTAASIKTKKLAKPRFTDDMEIPELTAEQKEAMAVLESGYNCFLTGNAGTGKSFVINEFIRRNQHKNILVCAPTGIAAINVKGSTLHRAFKISTKIPPKPSEYNEYPDNSVVSADVIIIDEISMCRRDSFEYVIRTIREAEEQQRKSENWMTASEKQIIVVGDFYQLAPVIGNNKDILAQNWDMRDFGDGYAFLSPLWKELNFKNIVLKEIIRQQDDTEYLKNLNKIRVGDSSGIYWFNDNAAANELENSITLCGRKDEADYKNNVEIAKLPGQAKVYKALVTGSVNDGEKLTDDELTLKIGAQVMTLNNKPDEGYLNGSIGVVTQMFDESVAVRFEDGHTVTISPHTWNITKNQVVVKTDENGKKRKTFKNDIVGTFTQIPLRVAYAITIHKSQGQTYGAANITPAGFANGQLYVALSRVKNIKGLHLNRKIYPQDIRTSNEVIKFYNEMEG